MKAISKNKRELIKIPIIIGLILFAGVGAYLTFFSKAASNGFYFTPSSSNVAAGSTFNVQVRLNYGSPVDTVQAYISYPSNLEVVGTPTVEQPFESEFENDTSTPGLIKIQRADFSDSPPTGDSLISNVTFRAKTGGSAVVSFTNDTYGVYQSNKITTISKNNATYNVTSTSASPPPSAPSGGSTSAPTTTSPTSGGTPSTASSPRPSNQTGGSTSAQPGTTSTPSSTTSMPDTVAGAPNTAIDNAGTINGAGSPQGTSEVISSSDSKSNPLIVPVVGTGLLLALAGAAHEILRRKGYPNGLVGYVGSLRNSSGLTKPNKSSVPGTSAAASSPGIIVGSGTAATAQDSYNPVVVTPTGGTPPAAGSVQTPTVKPAESPNVDSKKVETS